MTCPPCSRHPPSLAGPRQHAGFRVAYEYVFGSVVEEAREHLPLDFSYTVVKLNLTNQSVSFVEVADFDSALEPTIDTIIIYTRLRELPNDHLLEVKDVFRDPGSYALVTEFAEGGSLWDLMGGDAADEQRMALDELTVLTIAEEIIDGLAVLHDNDIVHRDIKPQNVLRCDDVWKIADFGISKLMNNPVTGYTFQGAHTVPWAPPEQIQGATAHPSADIYAWGRVVAFLLTGRTAIDAVGDVPGAWQQLLTACTSVVPEQRPEASAVKDRLEGDGR